MRWKVEGAVKDSGAEVSIRIDAATRALAERTARDRGILVSKLTPIKDVTTVADADTADAAPADIATPPKQNDSRPAFSVAEIPDYLGLKTAALGLRILSLVSFLLGIIEIIGGIAIATSGSKPDFLQLAPTTVVFIGIFSVMLGAIMQGLAAGCAALRDIARNSYRH
jgi:hypothetical protein